MKILIVPSWYYSKNTSQLNGIFFKEFAEALVTAGHEAAVLHFEVEFNIKNLNKGFSHNIVNGVHEFRFVQRNYTPKSAHGVELQKLLRTEYMSRMIEEEFGTPDIIHLESSGMINIANKLKKKWNVPVVYTEHLSNLLSDDPGKYYKNRFEEAVKSADACIAISSVYENKIKEYNPNRLVRIPNGLHTGSLDYSEQPENFIVKALGSLRKIKGYDVLIRAFAGFAADKNDVNLEIGGGGGEKAALQQLIDNLEMSEKICLTGVIPREQVASFYKDTSVFVCSSSTETFSIVTAEALCCGIPVISTRCGGPEDMIDESNGILIEVNNETQLELALNKMYQEKTAYDRQQIREKAQKCFDYDSVIDACVGLYTEVLENESGK